MPGLLSGQLIIEPWNAVSNLIFLFIVVRMTLCTRLSLHQHPLVVLALPFLFLGWIGGTLYHATRSHSAWLIMDFAPIILLTTAAAVELWRRLTGSWLFGFILFLVTSASGRLLAGLTGLERSVVISFGYASTALALLVPLILVVRRENWHGLRLFLGVVTSFAVALACRLLDRPGLEPLIPMGTHFLWHLFGGVSVWCLMELVVTLDKTVVTKNQVPQKVR